MAERWITRKGGTRSTFRYQHPHGRPVTDARTLDRIDRLRVPPAWTDVHIATDTRRAIQAWGFDVKGRKQYRYNERAVERRELRKYHRVRQLAMRLPAIRRTLRAQSHHTVLDCDTACAIALRLISESLFRPGSEKYVRENRSYGMTTLRKRHVQVARDRVVFSYTGKSSKKQRQVIVNPELVKLVRRMHRTPGERLFRYRAGTGWCDLSASTLIQYLRRIGPFAVKDFRTWGGTLRAATVLADLGPARSVTEAKRNVAIAMRIVASELGNTPAICRSSYVHPIILARYQDAGETIAIPRRAKRPGADTFAHSPEERALIQFLDDHFPERRRRPRTVMARAA